MGISIEEYNFFQYVDWSSISVSKPRWLLWRREANTKINRCELKTAKCHIFGKKNILTHHTFTKICRGLQIDWSVNQQCNPRDLLSWTYHATYLWCGWVIIDWFFISKARTYVEKVNEDVCRKGKYLELIHFILLSESIFILNLQFFRCIFCVVPIHNNIYRPEYGIYMQFYRFYRRSLWK